MQTLGHVVELLMPAAWGSPVGDPRRSSRTFSKPVRVIMSSEATSFSWSARLLSVYVRWRGGHASGVGG